MDLLTLFAETTQFDVDVAAAWSKALMLGLALGLAAFGLALVGSNYMKALGRNPEASTQIVILAAMIEVTALLAFLLGAFLL
jgi:F0F1-type ATP synthase membrane subunit c/vacuolar-type H+-ATPase subunit K